MASPAVSSQVDEAKLSLEDAATELYRLVEAHFDDLGLDEAERDRRYAAAAQRAIDHDAETSKR